MVRQTFPDWACWISLPYRAYTIPIKHIEDHDIKIAHAAAAAAAAQLAMDLTRQSLHHENATECGESPLTTPNHLEPSELGTKEL